jgi:hypothetical protein
VYSTHKFGIGCAQIWYSTIHFLRYRLLFSPILGPNVILSYCTPNIDSTCFCSKDIFYITDAMIVYSFCAFYEGGIGGYISLPLSKKKVKSLLRKFLHVTIQFASLLLSDHKYLFTVLTSATVDPSPLLIPFGDLHCFRNRR